MALRDAFRSQRARLLAGEALRPAERKRRAHEHAVRQRPVAEPAVDRAASARSPRRSRSPAPPARWRCAHAMRRALQGAAPRHGRATPAARPSCRGRRRRAAPPGRPMLAQPTTSSPGHGDDAAVVRQVGPVDRERPPLLDRHGHERVGGRHVGLRLERGGVDALGQLAARAASVVSSTPAGGVGGRRLEAARAAARRTSRARARRTRGAPATAATSGRRLARPHVQRPLAEHRRVRRRRAPGAPPPMPRPR